MPGPFLGSGDTRGCGWWLPSKTPQASRRDRERINAQGAKWRALWCDGVQGTWPSVASGCGGQAGWALSGSPAECSPSLVEVLTRVYVAECDGRSAVFFAQRRWRKLTITCVGLTQSSYSSCGLSTPCRPGHRGLSTQRRLPAPAQHARGAELSPESPNPRRESGGRKERADGHISQVLYFVLHDL